MYQIESIRRQQRAGHTDLEAYCRTLAIELEIGHADAFTIPRIAQQTQKTNQFNLTTRRYSEADVGRFSASADHEVFWLKVADKFGDMGIVGSCIVAYRGEDAVVDTLLLSCRALGRGIESRFLSELMHLARHRGARRMVGRYIATAKNGQVAGFYRSQGFSAAPSEDDVGECFSFDLSSLPAREAGVFASVKTPPDA